MKSKSEVFKRSKLDKFVIFLLVISIIVVVAFIATDHIPAWTYTWGTIFEVVNNFAISFVCTTIFYLLTVYKPALIEEKKKKKNAKIEFKALKRNIDFLGWFLLGQADMLSGAKGETKICQDSIQKACQVLSKNNKWTDENFYSLLQIQVNELAMQSELLLGKYEEIISEKMEVALRRFYENDAFYYILHEQKYNKRAGQNLLGEIFLNYYMPAEKLIELINMME